MGILNGGKKGFDYKHDLGMIRCFEDGVKAAQRMTAAQHYLFLSPGRYGLPTNDIRIQWIKATCSSAQEFNMRNRKLGRDKPPTKAVYVKRKVVINNKGTKIDEYVRPDGKKICGAQLRAHDEGWVCQKRPGEGTNHKGFGFCRLHDGDTSMSETKALWAELRNNKMARNLEDIIDNAEAVMGINKTIDADLMYLELGRQAVIRKMGMIQDLVTEKDIRLLKDITAAITATKKTKHFVESRGTIPATQVPQMIIQVIQTITAGEDIATRERIVRRAMNLQEDTVFPVLDNPDELPEYAANPKVMSRVKKALDEDQDWNEVAPKKPTIKKDGTLRYDDEEMEQ